MCVPWNNWKHSWNDLIVREIHNFSACQYKTQSPAIMAKFHDLHKKNFDAGIPDFYCCIPVVKVSIN